MTETAQGLTVLTALGAFVGIAYMYVQHRNKVPKTITPLHSQYRVNIQALEKFPTMPVPAWVSAGVAASSPEQTPGPDFKYRMGPPPVPGWYLTHVVGTHASCPNTWRWWNGYYWSIATSENDGPEVAAANAAVHTPLEPYQILWCADWPENARVPDTRGLP